ncbi:MAG: PilZ domain-containing protein [bacterium]|nr:PilZ domain-containing protein [bacterium]
MNKRLDKRVKTRQFAQIAGKSGMLSDVSEHGLHITTSSLPKKRKIDITFESLGQTITVVGVVKWYRKKTSLSTLNHLGVIIRNPPPEFFQFVNQNIQSANANYYMS